MSGYIPTHEDFNDLKLGGDLDFQAGVRSKKYDVGFIPESSDFNLVIGGDFDFQPSDLS